MNNDFTEVMSKRDNEDLIRIITVERDRFQPLAVEAAEAELKLRGIDSSRLESISYKIHEQDRAQKQINSTKVGPAIRFAHFIIDTICFYIVALLLSYFFDLFGTNDSDLYGYLLLFTGFMGYYFFMEAIFQKTLGKFITNSKVVMNDGTRPTTSDILIRTLYRLLPFDRLSFLFTGNGFHDRLSDTMIVKDR